MISEPIQGDWLVPLPSYILQVLLPKKLFIIKWINKILPLNQRHYIFNMTNSAECPSQCQGQETETHFLRCPHIARQEIYNAFIKQFPRIMRKNHMDPDLQHALYILLDTARIQQTPPFTRDYISILRQQWKIGIDSVFFGFFITEWTQMQHAYLKLMKLPSDKNEAAQCMSQIAISVYSYIHSLWLLRNSHAHNTDLLQTTLYHRL